MSTYRLTLAIHPSTYGFGYALSDGPLSLVDWGLAHAKGDKNAECLRKAEKLLTRYRPDSLVLEEFDTKASRRHPRIRKLCRSLVSLAAMHNVPTRIVSREKAARSLGLPEKATRYEVAKRLAQLFPELRHLLPPPRRAWENENPVLPLFASGSLNQIHL